MTSQEVWWSLYESNKEKIKHVCLWFSFFAALMWKMACQWGAALWTLRPAQVLVWFCKPTFPTASVASLSSIVRTRTLTCPPKLCPATLPLPATCKYFEDYFIIVQFWWYRWYKNEVSATNSCCWFALKGRWPEALGGQLATSVRQCVKTAVILAACCDLDRSLSSAFATIMHEHCFSSALSSETHLKC